MKKLYTLIACVMVMSMTSLHAQIVTSEPSPLQEDSEDVYLTYHADQGNQGLMGLSGATPVYAHIGVITNLSNGSWSHAPAWLDNSEKYQLIFCGDNTWELEIGDIREYFGITNPAEHVEKIAMVFRTADGSREGKTATGGDLFLDVLPSGFQMEFNSNSPFVLNSQTATVTYNVRTTLPSTIEIFLGSTSTTPIVKKENATELTTDYTFSMGDNYEVIARATANGESITKSLNVCYPPNSANVAYPGGGTPKMGAVAASNGDVTFCIAAPGKHNAMLLGSWGDYKPGAANVMNYTDVDGVRYFWLTVNGLDNTTEYPYYYLIDETIAVGDPYARLVLDPFSDKWISDGTYPGLMPYPSDKIDGNVMLAVYKGNRDDYNWKIKNFKGPDQDDLVIYELLFRDFTGTEGQARGNGTIKKAMEKMDYLQKLGVNAIELMPIQEFNGNNSWGYNTNFYFAPDKAYGTPDDYRAFIDECHRRGMAVILDVVFNQSEGLHPWYQMYPAGSNPFYNERAPHAYSVLNDWLQDNGLVQQQWTDMVTYWMTAYNVDGFRFDLVKGLGDNASYGGNANDYNTNKYNASRVARMKRITDVMKAINPNSYSINENLAGAQEENEMAQNGQLNWANINEPAGQFAMGYSSDSDCNRFYAPNDDNRLWGSTVSYAESHDEQRIAYKQNEWGVPGVKGNLAVSMRRCGGVAAQMLLAPGSHMIWQFGELGNATNTKNPDGGNNTDPKPVYWNYLNDPDRLGLYDNYRELISLRTKNPELFDKSAMFSMSCRASNWMNGRFIYASTTDKELVCVINPNLDAKTFEGVSFKKSNNSNYYVASSSYGTNNTFDASTGKVTVEGSSYIVIVSNNVTGNDNVIADEIGGAKVYGGYGEINIVGDYKNVEVYGLDGARLTTRNLPAGVYIVNVDGNVSKVVVR